MNDQPQNPQPDPINLCRFTDWHQWKVAHNLERKKEGESDRSLGLATGENDLPE